MKHLAWLKNTHIKNLCIIGAALALALPHLGPIFDVFATAPANTGLYGQLEIGGSVVSLEDVTNGDSVSASFGNGNTLSVTGTGLYSSTENNRYYVYGNGAVTVTATASNGYTADLIYGGNPMGQNTANFTLTNSNPVRVDGSFTQTTNPNPPVGNNKNASIAYTYSGSEVEFFLNDSHFDFEQATPGANNNENAGTYDGNLTYAYDDSGTVTLNLGTLFINRITSLKVNGTEYATTANFPTTPEQILNAIDGQIIQYSVQVPFADAYTISTTTVENRDEYMVVGNFLWSYQDKDAGTDDYMGHGKFELINVEYNGVTYTEDQLDGSVAGYLRWEEMPNGEEGGAILPVGTKVTARLIPDAGYQLTSFTINDSGFEAQEEIGVYTFEVEKGNFHLGAKFTVVDDVVEANAESVESGTITLGDGELDSGTAMLNVNEANLSASDLNGFKKAVKNYKIATYLDISLHNITYKGTAEEYWDSEIDELDHEATITLQLEEGVDGNDIVIVHQKHDGTYEIIPTVYDPVARTITFKTSSFSNYAIASRSIATVSSPETGATTTGNSTAELTFSSVILAAASIVILCIVKALQNKHKNE